MPSSSISCSIWRPRAGRCLSIRAATIAGSSTSRSSCRTWTRPTPGCARYKVRHASTGPQRLPDWNRNAGGIKAFYFKDPDGHALEILAFPADKGAPKWHRATDKLFLGIDHTAIVVDDTDQSLRFYRDGLGLTVTGESENYGIEQERLNNVFGARLRITGLTAGAGPGIELLEYLAPDDGRPTPADTRSNDLIGWQTRLRDERGSRHDEAYAGGNVRVRLARHRRADGIRPGLPGGTAGSRPRRAQGDGGGTNEVKV